jgi:PPM family protein phosphatase
MRAAHPASAFYWVKSFMQQTLSLEMISAGLTDVGRSRKRNEDCYDISNEIALAVVCDGMGGHAGGDIASRTAAETIVDFVYEFDPSSVSVNTDETDSERTQAGPGAVEPAVQSAVLTVRSAVHLANRKLVQLNQERGYPDGRGMGTTLVGLWQIAGTDKLAVFHAGDSRLYRLRRGELRQLTRDHSLYQIWLDNGQRGQAPHKNIIVRALGTSENVDPEISVHVIDPSDIYLLCSDGLTGLVTDGGIAEILLQGGADLESSCIRLVGTANDLGGHDNITVVLARFVKARA